MRLRWLLLLLWLVAVLFNSSVAPAPLPAPGFLSMLIFEAIHAVEYGLIAWFAWRAVAEPAGGVGLPSRLSAATIVVVGFVFAGLDELRQFFVAGGSASAWQILLDGGALSLVVALRTRQTAGEGQTNPR